MGMPEADELATWGPEVLDASALEALTELTEVELTEVTLVTLAIDELTAVELDALTELVPPVLLAEAPAPPAPVMSAPEAPKSSPASRAPQPPRATTSTARSAPPQSARADAAFKDEANRAGFPANATLDKRTFLVITRLLRTNLPPSYSDCRARGPAPRGTLSMRRRSACLIACGAQAPSPYT
jgi:hypothetical protein